MPWYTEPTSSERNFSYSWDDLTRDLLYPYRTVSQAGAPVDITESLESIPTPTRKKRKKSIKYVYKCDDCFETAPYVHDLKLCSDIGGEYCIHVCDKCITRYKYCVDCGGYFISSILTYIQRGLEDFPIVSTQLCNHCITKYIHRCNICNTILLTPNKAARSHLCNCLFTSGDKLYHLLELLSNPDIPVSFIIASEEEFKNHMCAECKDKVQLKIHDYSYKPEPIFYKVGKETKRIHFGIELEVEDTRRELIISDNWSLVTIDKSILPKDLIYFKHDSSISYGFEIVSHPCTLKYWHSVYDKMEQLFDFIKTKGGKSYNTVTCGMHVHIDKNAFSVEQLTNFVYFIYENPEFIHKISRRTKNNFDTWSSLKSCSVEQVEECIRGRYVTPNRHIAVNLCDFTVEVRIFRGTLATAGFYANLEFCAALVKYLQLTDDIRLDSFLKFVKEYSITYPNLCAFMELLAKKEIEREKLTAKSIENNVLIRHFVNL